MWANEEASFRLAKRRSVRRVIADGSDMNCHLHTFSREPHPTCPNRAGHNCVHEQMLLARPAPMIHPMEQTMWICPISTAGRDLDSNVCMESGHTSSSSSSHSGEDVADQDAVDEDEVKVGGRWYAALRTCERTSSSLRHPLRHGRMTRASIARKTGTRRTRIKTYPGDCRTDNSDDNDVVLLEGSVSAWLRISAPFLVAFHSQLSSNI